MARERRLALGGKVRVRPGAPSCTRLETPAWASPQKAPLPGSLRITALHPNGLGAPPCTRREGKGRAARGKKGKPRGRGKERERGKERGKGQEKGNRNHQLALPSSPRLCASSNKHISRDRSHPCHLINSRRRPTSQKLRGLKALVLVIRAESPTAFITNSPRLAASLALPASARI